MSDQPTSPDSRPPGRAWQADPFWTDVVCIITGGPDRKLRADHYLEGLGAEDLETLRWVCCSPGTLAEHQLLCPKRVGGPRDGALPTLSLLSELEQAVRQSVALNELRLQDAREAAASERLKVLGVDPRLTNAVLRVIGEEALAQKADKKLGSFALGAANVLLAAESSRVKGKQEEVKIQLRKQKLGLDERDLALKEKKAEAYDRAQAALTAAKETKGGITPETLKKIEQELRLF